MRKYLKEKWKESKEESYQQMNYPTKTKSVWGGVYGIFVTVVYSE